MNLQNKISQQSMPAIIQTNVPLANKNWFKTGGQAQFFAAPTTVEQFWDTLQYARDNNLEIFVLGSGANILISDDGFNGLVIRPQITTIEHRDGDENYATVTAGAGVSIDYLIGYCLEHNFTGLEEFSGIPGTVGGSVYINIHYFQFFLSQFLIQATVIEKESGEIKTVDHDWFNFGYDQSKLFEQHHYLVDATFKLKKCSDIESAYAKGRSTEIIRHRNQRYPTSHTCGSFFRNFHTDEVTLESNGNKMIYVAYYLDKIGAKGSLRIGDAIVSHKHANMLVNAGTTTSTDIINLARTMQKMVKKKFGLVPQPECQLIGFKNYPLIR